MRTNRLQRFAVPVLLGLLGWFAVTAVAPPLLRPYHYSDFATFYSAALAFRNGTDPYELTSLQQTGEDRFSGWIGRYLYPPPFAAVVMQPLASLPFPVARRLWVVVEVLAFLGALLLLASVAFGKADRDALMWTGLIGLTWAPFRLDLRLGSVSGVLLLLLCASLWLLHKKRDTGAGAFLGVAALLKVSPALLIALLALRGHRRVAVGAVVAVAAAILLCLPATGLQAWRDFVQEVIPVLSSENFSWFTNQSLDSLFCRLFQVTPDSTPWFESKALYRVASLGTSLVALSILAWLALQRQALARADAQRTVWLASLGMLVAVLVARVSWEYMTVLAIPCFVLWMQHLRQRRASRRQWLLFLLGWVLCAAPFPYSTEPLRQGPGLLLMSPRLFGMLLAFVGIAHVLRLQPDSRAVDRQP